jgi:preprotein translocase subunit SecD
MRRRSVTPLVFIVLVALGVLGAVLATGTTPALGLDLQGGVSVVLQPTEDASDDALDQTIEIIRNRVDALGVAEPDIARQGRSVIVQLPGVENQQRALELVGDTAELRFRPVLSVSAAPDPDAPTTTTTAPPADGSTTSIAPDASTTTAAPVEGQSAGSAAVPYQEDPAATTTTTAPAATTTTTPAPTDIEDLFTPREEDVADQPVLLPERDEDGRPVGIYQLGPSAATGQIVQTASAELDPSSPGRWQVKLVIKGGESIDQFNAIAAVCNQRQPDVCPTGQLAIVLDSEVVSAPGISEPSYARDQIRISGGFGEREAKDLALVLRYGSLPVNLEPQTVQTVSATLGDDSLRAGLLAGLVGLGLVCLYILFYYRALGLVVVLGLAVWSALNYGIIAWLGESRGLALSLSGVTGIVVSVGVTVDSYVVYFERLKDEIRAGRTLRTTTERAFQRAFRTILAADISSFIGAALLYWLTVGPVRGFAFFLGLATILDVIVAWFFTRPMVGLLSRSRFFTGNHWFGLSRGLTGEATSAQVAVAPTGGGR